MRQFVITSHDTGEVVAGSPAWTTGKQAHDALADLDAPGDWYVDVQDLADFADVERIA